MLSGINSAIINDINYELILKFYILWGGVLIILTIGIMVVDTDQYLWCRQSQRFYIMRTNS